MNLDDIKFDWIPAIKNKVKELYKTSVIWCSICGILAGIILADALTYSFPVLSEERHFLFICAPLISILALLLLMLCTIISIKKINKKLTEFDKTMKRLD